MLVGLALCLGVAAMIAFNAVTAQNELKREFELLSTNLETEEKKLKEEIHSLKTKQEQQKEQTEGTNLQVGYLMGQMDSLLTVKEGAVALLVSTVAIAIGVVLLCLFCQNNLVYIVSMPSRMLRMIEQ